MNRWVIVVVVLVVISTTVSSTSIVTTNCGAVQGIRQPLSNSTDYVTVYHGIPYAQPPVESLRWQAPQPMKCPWSGVLNGTVPTTECLQPGGEGNEDCLHLNVVVPTSLNLTSPLPVLVWFHGGNLIGGNIMDEGRNGVIAINSRVIVVSIAYRFGVLGWLATPDMLDEQSSAGNYGLLDAIHGLKWIRDNIATFGGDPKSVSLFGQSSGGTLIFGVLSSRQSEGLFSAAYSMSGSPNITMSSDIKFLQDSSIVSTLGCSSNTTSKLRMVCLRSLSASTVAKSMPQPWMTPGIWGFSDHLELPAPPMGEAYAGIIYVDGNIIKSSFMTALFEGVNANVSLIISSMAAEGDHERQTNFKNKTMDDWKLILNTSLKRWNSTSNVTAEIMNAYVDEAMVEPQLAYDTLVSDYGLTCGNVILGQQVVKIGTQRHAPTYLLYNAWPLSKFDGWPYHGLDLQLAGGDIGDSPNATDVQGVHLMQKLLYDMTYNKGVMPQEWQPLVPNQPPVTLVMAPPTSEWRWPGGGVRAEASWRQTQCSVLQRIGLASQIYWWCD